MYFYLQKTILLLLLPPSGPLLLILAGLLIAVARYKKTGRVIAVTGLILLYLLSIEAVSGRLITPLELEHPPLKEGILSADAIVVLTSGAKDCSFIGLKPQPSHSSVFRLVKGISIFRKMSETMLIICGGAGDPKNTGLSEGAALADVAVSLGFPVKYLTIEDRSRNTYEGAAEVSRIMKGKGKRIVLVTSAYHIGRSVKLFRNAGFEVIPAPADYLSEVRGLGFYSFIPGAGNIETSAAALYEYLSRIWYLGRISLR